MRLDHVIAKQIHIPNYQSSRGKIIGALLRHGSFGSGPVITFAPHFHGENGRSFKKLHASPFANMESDVRTKRFAVRKMDSECGVIPYCVTSLRSTRVLA